MNASTVSAKMDRHSFADALLKAHNGIWPDMEGLIRDLYVAHARPGDCMLDVGVNHGGHFIQMAQAVGPTGRVIGFEAAPEMCRRTLAAIAEHYPAISSRIRLYQCAVSSQPGKAKFYFSKINDSGLSSLANRSVLSEGEFDEIMVDVFTVDSLVDDDFVGRLTFAKFDIEGAEFDAFKGARKILARRPLLTFEWDSSAPKYFSYQPSELVGLLHEYGYTIYDLFGFAYNSTEEFVDARVWNFICVPPGMDATQAIAPSIDTMRQSFPDLFA